MSAAGLHPRGLDSTLLNEIVPVSEREAIAAVRLCARIEGMPIGISSGAALHAAVDLARLPENEGRLVGVIAPSFAERCLSIVLFAGS